MVNRTIKELDQLLSSTSEDKLELLQALKQDERKGVQQLVERWLKMLADERKEIERLEEMQRFERELYANGAGMIAGVDEVGRGPLAGPVVAAAVILPQYPDLPGINDSKKLSDRKRELLYAQINEQAISVGIGIVSAKQIDEINIYEATKKAMIKALNQLHLTPDHVLIDAMKLDIPLKQTSIVKGDAKSISIAAGAIVAKVTRDRLMKKLSVEYPHYGFDSHMGYGTPKHLKALELYGITNEHRKTFAPVEKLLLREDITV